MRRGFSEFYVNIDPLAALDRFIDHLVDVRLPMAYIDHIPEIA
tara:strand:+ start:350 stop:478 length:129 start_codon:yes stop_codon:yes gene_type:complete